MCTLSVIASPGRDALRLMMNRDERRLRPVAQPPVPRITPIGTVVWPTDPVSGGSWIATNDAGLTLAVMNVNGARTPVDTPSRGTLVPLLASCRSIDELTARWLTLDTAVFAPFRLIAVTLRTLAVFEGGVRDPDVTPVGRAHVFSSSSLGDDLVAGPRRQLLADLLRREADPWMAQTRFHQHAWPDRRHLSVMMSRADACTVSCTEVVLASEAAIMTYRPVLDGWPAVATTRRMPVAAQVEYAA